MYIPKKRERKKKVAVFLEKNASKLKHFRRTIVVRFSCPKSHTNDKPTKKKSVERV